MRVRGEVLDAIRGHARGEHPRECCGVLLGVDDEVIEAVPARNVAAQPLRRYEVSPEDHLAQIKRCRTSTLVEARATRIVGVYHSHPHSAAVPSPTDLEQAFGEYIYLIAGPVEPPSDVPVRGYQLRAGQFEEIDLVVERND
jgi:proteasome lid subunit RPN8/RPN11